MSVYVCVSVLLRLLQFRVLARTSASASSAPGCSATCSASVQFSFVEPRQISIRQVRLSASDVVVLPALVLLHSYFVAPSLPPPRWQYRAWRARLCATVFVCVVVFPPLAAIYDTIHTRTDTHTHTQTHLYTCMCIPAEWLT